MPTYGYRCGSCGHEFDRYQSITAEPIKECPACGKAEAKRQIGAGAGFLFKGTGFYITDYRNPGYAAAAKQDGGAAASGGESKAASESKPSGGEAKPAAASAPKKADSASAA